MRSTRFSIPFRLWLGASVLCCATSGHGLDVHLQHLPVAPGLTPSAALDPLEGLREALNCGLDFLGTAQSCGLSAPSETASPFLVRFDPLFCRLTMRFAIGELIDGLLGRWLAGAFANLETPVIGALCLLGIGPRDCGSPETAALPRSPVVPHRAPPAPTSTARHSAFQDALRAAQEEPAARGAALSPPPPETDRHDATGLDSLTR